MFLKKLYNDLDTIVDEAIAGSRLIAKDSEKYSRLLPDSRITVSVKSSRTALSEISPT